MTYSATDEFGHCVVENVVTPNDYQATLMSRFGLDHSQKIYHHNGQPQVITANRSAKVVAEILNSPRSN